MHRWRTLGGGIVLLYAVVHAPALAADVLTLADGDTRSGTFLGYRSGQFEMRTSDEKPIKIPQIRVAALTVSPPVRVQLRRRGGKNLDDIRLTGYTKPNFAFTTATGDLQVPAVQVAALEAQADFQREMQHVADSDRAAASTAPHDATFELPIQTGRVTVVQFHMDSVMASVRQGGYVRAQCEENPKKLAFVRVDLTGWNDPVAQRYGITSVPQFWFYNSDGILDRKLTDRFTSEDLDGALKSARQ